jgi:Icc-related predicted phosphoesterase
MSRSPKARPDVPASRSSGRNRSQAAPAIKQFVAEGVEEVMRLETALRTLRTERRVVVLHYAPVAATVEGEPKEIFPFLGSSRLAETIDRFGLSAILHGHAHLGTYAAATDKGTRCTTAPDRSRNRAGARTL